MRPLDRLSSIKVKLGTVIVAAVGVTAGVMTLGVRAGIPSPISAVTAGGIALGVVQLLAHGMTSPLREMADAATAMARGDYSRRVTATSRDEVGTLARAFNEMSGQLAEVDRVRRELVANVSHELRTPISALQAVLENVVDGVERPDPEVLRTMLGQVQRLGGLVNQLLDLSRLESGTVPLQRRAFDVRALLEEAAQEARLHADGVHIDIAGRQPGPVVNADRARLHQVLANLLDNALRYSPAGGVVRLGAERARGTVTIEVCDEGPGIDPEQSDRIFERFYRTDAARTSSGGGAGLGLAIARWIVELHGGQIRAEAGDPRGCRMVVTLPGARS